MRDKFPEFYKPVDQDLDDFWQGAIFSYDANTLLNLYRYTETTRNDFLDTLRFLKDRNRLWLTYQASYEYMKNRLIVIDSQKKAYDELKKLLSKNKGELEAQLKSYKRHPYLNMDEIEERLSELYKEFDGEFDQLDKDHPDYMDNDPIFEKLTEIFGGCVGEELSDAELAAIFKEGKDRYEKKIPPGYMDKKEKENSGDLSLYGDLIIWKELLKRFNGNNEKVIFVTDDLKEDWWLMFKGQTISPRPELLKEFIKETTKQILIYKPEQFLKYSKEKLDQPVTKGTLDEVEKVREYDESLLENLRSYNWPTGATGSSLYNLSPTGSVLNRALAHKSAGSHIWDPFQYAVPHSLNDLLKAKVYLDVNGYLPQNFSLAELYLAGLISADEFLRLHSQLFDEEVRLATEPSPNVLNADSKQKQRDRPKREKKKTTDTEENENDDK